MTHRTCGPLPPEVLSVLDEDPPDYVPVGCGACGEVGHSSAAHVPERTNAERRTPESDVCPGCGWALDCIEKTYSCHLGENCKCGSRPES